MEITSLTNQKVKDWVKLKQKKYRTEQGLFLIEGEHLLTEALKYDIVETVLIRKDSNFTLEFNDIVYVTDEIMQKVSNTVSLVDVVGICRIQSHSLSYNSNIVLLDTIQDPGNLGTIIRTALSFGFNEIALSMDCVDIYNEKVIRSTQGALFQIKFEYVDLKCAMHQLKKNDVTIYGTALKNAVPLQSVVPASKVAVLLGNEGNGVRQELLDQADQNIKIEMKEFESLNVAIAAGICLYTLGVKK